MTLVWSGFVTWPMTTGHNKMNRPGHILGAIGNACTDVLAVVIRTSKLNETR